MTETITATALQERIGTIEIDFDTAFADMVGRLEQLSQPEVELLERQPMGGKLGGHEDTMTQRTTNLS